MSEKKYLFSKLDRFLFQKVDSFQTTSQFQNINNWSNNIEDRDFQIIRILFLLLAFFLPLSLVLVAYLQLKSIKSDLRIRHDLITTANEIISSKQDLVKQEINYYPQLSSPPTETMIKSKINSILSSNKIESNSVVISEFATEEKENNTSESKFLINFKNLSNEAFWDLLIQMINREKMHFENFDLKLNNATNLLEGNFLVFYNVKLPKIE
jgi:hypothetical protein